MVESRNSDEEVDYSKYLKTDANPRINIGSEFQAIIPSLMPQSATKMNQI